MSTKVSNVDVVKIDKSKFAFITDNERTKDKKIETKALGYFQDAARRFAKNKGSVIAAIIILMLVLYAIIAPFCIPKSYTEAYGNNKYLVYYKQLKPKISLNEGSGFWDGSSKVSVSRYTYDIYRSKEIETGHTGKVITKDNGLKYVENADGSKSKKFDIRIDSYYTVETIIVTTTMQEYQALQSWQDENQIQVILPYVDTELAKGYKLSHDIWYVSNEKGTATYKDGTIDPVTGVGEFIPAYLTATTQPKTDYYTSTMRLASDPYNNGDNDNAYRYAVTVGNGSIQYRVSPYDFFIYTFGFEPSFIFGTESNGYDIFSRLGSGARFSFLLAIGISFVNLLIGTIYGSIEGYYGGVTDMVMERISDILSNVPFTVVTVLFKLHIAKDVGILGSLIFAFILTGWIGMASRVRMQFYRFKNQEYVLAARTLGAKDTRIMFKHILPNALGTLITSCVLVIPGVIFSETSLSYLGIINLETGTRSSIGTMLSAGQKVMTSAPHVIFFPALFIALLEICFNLFGNGLRDAFNPALRGSEE